MRSFEIILVLILGFILDVLLGDPPYLIHPVVIIGKLIGFLEKAIRELLPKTKAGERLGGGIMTFLVIAISFILPWFILMVVKNINYLFKIVLEVFWCWQILAIKTMAVEAKGVFEPLEDNDIPRARKQVARIVGRDTDSLDEVGVIKAAVETVAESTSDGIVAPMLFMAIGGIPLGFLYKAVNTMDSMVGYKNERYRFFGTASARMDDLLNFIPARLTALLMIAGARVIKLDYGNAYAVWKRDRKKHASPNSGNPESACAGALGIKLGGDAYYFGELYHKETLGDDLRRPEKEDILMTVKLMYVTSILCLVVMIIGRLFI